MTRYSILGFLLFFSTLLFAQNVSYSEYKKISSKTPQFRILGKNNEGVIMQEYSKYENIIEAYSPTMKLKWQKKLNIKQPNAQIKKIIIYPNQSNFIYLAPAANTSWNIFAQSMDARFVNGIKFTRLDSVYYGKDDLSESIKVIHSKNKDKIAVAYPVANENALNFIVINKSLEVLLKRRINFALPEGDYALNEILIDDSSNIYVTLYDNTKIKRDENYSNRIKVFMLNKSLDYAPQLINMNFDRNIFGQVKFDFDNVNKQLVAAGLFTDENKKQSKGYFFKAFNITENVLTKDYNFTFNNEQYLQIAGKETNQSLNGLSTFEITDLILRFDGGVNIIAESRFNNVENMQVPSFVPAAGPTFRTVTVTYCNDIMLLSITPDGKQDWFKVLRKRQVSEDDDGFFSSYALHTRGESLHFIYNDDIQQKANVVSYKAETNGEIKRAVILNASEQEMLCVPRLGKQISSNEIIIPAFRKNTLRLIKLSY